MVLVLIGLGLGAKFKFDPILFLERRHLQSMSIAMDGIRGNRNERKEANWGHAIYFLVGDLLLAYFTNLPFFAAREAISGF